VGIFRFIFVFGPFPVCVVLGVDEVVAAVDGRDAGGEGGGDRGELEESDGVVTIAVCGVGRKLWSRHADVSGGVQPDGLRLPSQVVLTAPLNCLTLFLGASGCLPQPDAYLLG
jgi:hypothetical protein